MEQHLAGIILTGGLSRRMGGGDKTLLRVGGKRLLDLIIERAALQVAVLAINANGDAGRFQDTGLPVISDDVPDFPGPLAGILAGMDWARRTVPDCRWLVSFAGDAPLIPADLVTRLLHAVEGEGAQMACASSGGRAHSVVGLWPVSLAGELRHALVDEDVRKVRLWTSRYKVSEVPWPADPIDPFFNVNTPEDLARLERLLKSEG